VKLRLYCHAAEVGVLDATEANEPQGWTLTCAKPLAIPLSPNVPAGLTWRGAEVRDFFVNLLPESPHAERVAARFDPPPRSEAQLLACIGQEMAGAYALSRGDLPKPSYSATP
jgi:HipA-like protein